MRLPSLTERYVLPSEMCGDYFVVEARINGAGPFPLLMDSGAGTTVLDPEVVQTAGLRKAVDSLAIGEFKAYNFGYREHDMQELSAALGRRIDGIVGHPVFNPLLLTYDFPGRQLAIQVGRLNPDSSTTLRSGMNRPYVRGQADGKAIWVLIDTGSSRGLSLDNLESFKLDMAPTATGGRMRINGLFPVETGRLAGVFDLGGQELDRPFVARTQSIHLVGQEVLHHFALTFDHRSRLLHFARAETTAVPAYPVRMAEFVADPVTGRIEHVFDQTAGYEVGDIVWTIDDRPYLDRTCPMPHAEPPAPTSRTVRVIRGPDTLSIDGTSRYLMPEGR